MMKKIGVAGAAKVSSPKVLELSKEIGREIARHGCACITGGTHGVGHHAALGAKEENGLTIAVSPAMNLKEHVEKYKFPTEGQDVMLFTGFEREGRNLIWVRSCDAVVIVNGKTGTLNEFTIAFNEGRTIGVLEGTGGVADKAREMIDYYEKETGSKVVYAREPKELIEKLLKEI